MSNSTAQVTKVQAKILKELLADGRKTDTEIAKKLGLTKASTKKDILQMEKNGVISGATIHINYKSFGYSAVANILLSIDPQQEQKLVELLQKMPEVYSFYNRGVEGNVGIIVTLRTLEELNGIKDKINRSFSISEIKTSIWTDVKEMNENLSIINGALENRKEDVQEIEKKETGSKPIEIDEIDQKITNKLAENGRIPMNILGKEIGVSTDTAKRRYEKLKKNGILKVTIQINPRKIGYLALIIFFTTTSKENSDCIVEKLCKIPNVISVMKTSGDYDLQIYAMAQDLSQLLDIQEQTRKIHGITRIEPEILRFGEEWTKWPSPRQYISTF